MDTMQAQLEQYQEVNGIWSLEGHRGVRNLEVLVKDMGGYRSMNEFLEDNPGAMQAMLEWLYDQRSPEWSRSLTDQGYDGQADDQDDEADGQPDEAQEWESFDPDC
jgi:hypothetical protein